MEDLKDLKMTELMSKMLGLRSRLMVVQLEVLVGILNKIYKLLDDMIRRVGWWWRRKPTGF